jgi:SpoVK/Ycf46/Vps4 family AAA+-type ATPase
MNSKIDQPETETEAAYTPTDIEFFDDLASIEEFKVKIPKLSWSDAIVSDDTLVTLKEIFLLPVKFPQFFTARNFPKTILFSGVKKTFSKLTISSQVLAYFCPNL